MQFADRSEAGRILAGRLSAYANRPGTIVLGLPRGGVTVAYEVARALNLPMDVFIVRKLGVPGHEELAMGALASGGVTVINEDVVRTLRISEAVIEAASAREQRELERREKLYRGGKNPVEVGGKIVILVDDGLATGSTMRAAVTALRRMKNKDHVQPARIVVAVPVAAVDTRDDFMTIADDMICLRTPEPFTAVGLWYKDFTQTTDEEVRELLERSAHPPVLRSRVPGPRNAGQAQDERTRPYHAEMDDKGDTVSH